LFHELVHASREMRGVFYFGLGGVNHKYGNEEEYLAIVVTNIYLSEKRRLVLRADHSINNKDPNHARFRILEHPEKFFNNFQRVNLSPRMLMARFRLGQRVLFHRLALIDEERAWFNPAREFEDEVKRGRIQCTATQCGPDRNLE